MSQEQKRLVKSFPGKDSEKQNLIKKGVLTFYFDYCSRHFNILYNQNTKTAYFCLTQEQNKFARASLTSKLVSLSSDLNSRIENGYCYYFVVLEDQLLRRLGHFTLKLYPHFIPEIEIDQAWTHILNQSLPVEKESNDVKKDSLNEVNKKRKHLISSVIHPQTSASNPTDIATDALSSSTVTSSISIPTSAPSPSSISVPFSSTPDIKAHKSAAPFAVPHPVHAQLTQRSYYYQTMRNFNTVNFFTPLSSFARTEATSSENGASLTSGFFPSARSGSIHIPIPRYPTSHTVHTLSSTHEHSN